MRVLHLVTSLSLSGAERVAYELASDQVRRGAQVTVAAVGRASDRKVADSVHSQLTSSGVAIYELSKSMSRSRSFILASIFQLRWLIRTEKPDVLHVHTDIPDFVAAFGLFGAPRPTVYRTIHNTVFRPGRRIIPIIIERMLAPDFKIAVSKDAASAWRAFMLSLRLKSGPIQVVENVPFNSSCRQREESKKELDICCQDLSVAFIGRLAEQKGFDLLCSAAGDPAWPPNVTLNIFGSGPLQGLLGRLPPGRVLYHGFRPGVDELVRAFDAVIFPSRFEGLPLSMLECLAAGVPVLASRCDGIKGYLGDSYAMYLGDPLDQSIVLWMKKLSVQGSLESIFTSALQPSTEVFFQSYWDAYRDGPSHAC